MKLRITDYDYIPFYMRCETLLEIYICFIIRILCAGFCPAILKIPPTTCEFDTKLKALTLLLIELNVDKALYYHSDYFVNLIFGLILGEEFYFPSAQSTSYQQKQVSLTLI